MEPDFPCICGHSWQLHSQGLELHYGPKFLTGCNAEMHYGSFCYEFVPNNLKYLELRDLQKGV